jgi:hypothetical protein
VQLLKSHLGAEELHDRSSRLESPKKHRKKSRAEEFEDEFSRSRVLVEPNDN